MVEVNGNMVPPAGSRQDPKDKREVIACPGVKENITVEKAGGLFGPRWETVVRNNENDYAKNEKKDKENALKWSAEEDAGKRFRCKDEDCHVPCVMKVTVTDSSKVKWKGKVKFSERWGKDREAWWWHGTGTLEYKIECECPEKKVGDLLQSSPVHGVVASVPPVQGGGALLDVADEIE